MSASAKTGALLVEARTEELPPQLLPDLANQFPDSLLTNLKRAGFADDDSHREQDGNGKPKLLATPRRVAALLKNIRRAAPDRMLTRRGPQVASALDKDGRPTKALEGFLRATGSQFGDLRKLTERGREYFAVDLRETGGTLDAKLAGIVQETLLSLNAPRLMRWGDNDWRFIRPLRGVVMLWGSDAIAGEVMGVQAGRTTLGHRFMSEGEVEIASATEYESAMRGARVVADFYARVKKINNECESVADENGGVPLGATFADFGTFPKMDWIIAAMTEYPRVHCGNIRPEFMDIPADCFNLCLQKHQRCFPMEDAAKNRLPHFLYVADNAPQDAAEMTRGFERVISARLADVAFYLAEDKKTSPEGNREKLKRIAYHEKLGSQFDRAERIRAIAAKIGAMMNLDEAEMQKLDRAAFICKADLPTLMVAEHPELEGIMAAEYYADDDEVGEIVQKHNLLLPDRKPSVLCLQLANCMEKIAGMFWAGEKPTGDKDPHGLRGKATSVAYALLESKLQVRKLIGAALSAFAPDSPSECADEIYNYIAERARQHPRLSVRGQTAEANAIFSQRPDTFSDIESKQDALTEFKGTPEAATLIEANKRINNILRKSGANPDDLPEVDGALFQSEEEKRLDSERREVAKQTADRMAEQDFGAALQSLSSLAAPLDAFFEKVMVNADEPEIRANRFALLAELRKLLNQVADISKLAG